MSDNRIKILPENIANKIAAGEVVQRPESVVKELLENSIDAGSSEIDLIIKKAGKSLIQVCDNGSGMNEEDAILCIQKHATSKIKEYEDLEAISTLGFRGEALSSIAAVSQLEIKTERKEDEIGTLIRIEDDESLTKLKGSYPKGTSISVKNLFFNTPARRNFLKTDATELKHIIDTFNKIALSHPETHFRLFNDNDVVFDYKSGTLENRINSVFADNMLNALLPAKENTDLFNVNGYIGKPSLLKKNKGEQYLFLNKRYVQSKQINHAVFTAYENILEKGDYPFFILFIELDPRRIDINVHPSKLEVRFEDEKDIYNIIVAVVKRSLRMHDLVPSMTITPNERGEEKIFFNSYVKAEKDDFSDRPKSSAPSNYKKEYSDSEIDQIFSGIPDDLKGNVSLSNMDLPVENIFEPLPKTQERIFQSNQNEETSAFIIQLHNKYILSQIKTGLMIIDQHVAHERILYEKIKKKYEGSSAFSQNLLFPLTLELDPGKFNVVKELHPYLTKIGFDIKFFSKNTVVIEGVPEDIKSGHEEKILMEIVDEYVINFREKKLDEIESLAKAYSCKAAIKAGDSLNEKEMRLLIDQLFATENPYVCPHGRPIVIKISLDEFDRRFGRT